MRIDTNWTSIGKSWTLISYEEKNPGTWEKYLKRKEEYWGGKGDKKKWLEEQKQGYKEYVDYCKKWCGLFSLNQKIPVFQQDKKSVVKLCEVIDGKWNWDKCIELWKLLDIKIFPPTFVTKCEMYNFGFLYKGKKKGSQIISHSKGDYKLSFESDNSIIKLKKIGTSVLGPHGETIFKVNKS